MKFLLFTALATTSFSKVPQCENGQRKSEQVSTIYKLLEANNYNQYYQLKNSDTAKALRNCYDSMTKTCKRSHNLGRFEKIIDKLTIDKAKLPQSQVLKKLIDEKIAKCNLYRFTCKNGRDSNDFMINAVNLRQYSATAPAKLSKKYAVALFKCLTDAPNSPFASCRDTDTREQIQKKQDYFKGEIGKYYGANAHKKMRTLLTKQLIMCGKKYSKVSQR